MSLLDEEIRRIFKKAVRERWSKEKLRAEITKVASPFFTKKNLEKQIKAQSKDLEWLQAYTTDNGANKDLTTYFNKSYQYYSQQKDGLNNDIINIVSNGFAKDLDDSAMINQLESTLNKWQQHAKTIVNTAQMQLSIVKFKIDAEESGVEKFRYSGPPPQRPICKLYFQKELTLKEINSISERLGYDFFIERGKWNCRHFWEAVVGASTTPVETKNEQIATDKTIRTDNYDEAITNQEKWIEGLNEQQKNAVSDYTDMSYWETNDFLRNNRLNGIQKSELEKRVNDLEELLSKAPKFKGETHRGIGMEKSSYESFKKAVESSDVYYDKAFMSTTYDSEESELFAEEGDYTVRIKINGSNGVPIDKLSNSPHEKEVIYNRNTKFKIISVKEENKTLYLDLEEF